VVARDSRGIILSAWAKNLEVSDAIVTVVAVIKWESDAKMHALVGTKEVMNWNIMNLCSDIKFLVLDFVSCVFVWVKREAHSVTYELSKFAYHLRSPFICNQDSLPPSVLRPSKEMLWGFPFELA
jgi:hypothetical protein